MPMSTGTQNPARQGIQMGRVRGELSRPWEASAKNLNGGVIDFKVGNHGFRVLDDVAHQKGVDRTSWHPSQKPSSKIDLCPELYPTWIVLSRGFAERAIRQVGIHRVKVRPI